MGVQHEKRKRKRKKRKRKEKKEKKETNLVMLTGLLHYCTLLSKEFLLFSTVPLFVEPNKDNYSYPLDGLPCNSCI